MTYTKLPGVYFGESVTTIADTTGSDEVLTFIVQTSSTITSIDDKLTLFTSFDAFNTVATNKGLTKTLAFINKVLAATGHTQFYVYSVKTDTSAGWTAAITSSSHLKENMKFIYYEETASSGSMTLASKISTLATACATCYGLGAFRVSYVIPYGTLAAAITAATSTPAESTIVTQFTSILSGDGNSRVVVLLPDGEDAMMATIINAGYTTEPGYPVVSGNVSTLTYEFTRDQMLTLQNLGVCFLRKERVNGILQYRINLGVNTAFKSSKADGLIFSRAVADQLLREVDEAVEPFIKEGETTSNLTFVQTAVDGVVAEFVTDELVKKDGTKLTVVDSGNMTFGVTGTITTTKSLIAIDVAVTIA